MANDASAEQEESHRFLTPERIANVGALIEPLIRDDLSWIERRKEQVTILDDTALRREISTDFSLRRTAKPIADAVPADSPERLYCAPVFMLPKAPANLMAFDLVDESGQSLRVVSRLDNAQISGVALCRMAERVLLGEERTLPEPLAHELKQIAQVNADEGKQRALRVKRGLQPEYAEESAVLAADERFCWWLSALAHSSILVVIFRAVAPRRKIFKLAFEQPIESELKWRTSLGWDPYKVWVDSPLIEARTYHFEADAPPGLRITEATLNDDRHEDAVEDHGFLRRVHLYREDAAKAGAGTAVMHLCVGTSFGSGAFLSAALTTAALFGAAAFAEKIATNPTSAPTLLLFLPGLIATYIALPQQHALTARLLRGARLLLILIAFLAYAAAARVALTGGLSTGTSGKNTEKLVEHSTSSLQLWLYPSGIVSFLLLAALGVTYLRVRRPMEGWAGEDDSLRRYVGATVEQVSNYLAAVSLVPAHYELVDAGQNEMSYIRSAWHGFWTMTATVRAQPAPDPSEGAVAVGSQPASDSVSEGQEAGVDAGGELVPPGAEIVNQPQGCWVTLESTYVSRATQVGVGRMINSDRITAQTFLTELQAWAIEEPTPVS
jgi:hypothetical protein